MPADVARERKARTKRQGPGPRAQRSGGPAKPREAPASAGRGFDPGDWQGNLSRGLQDFQNWNAQRQPAAPGQTSQPGVASFQGGGAPSTLGVPGTGGYNLALPPPKPAMASPLGGMGSAGAGSYGGIMGGQNLKQPQLSMIGKPSFGSPVQPPTFGGNSGAF